MNSIVTLLVEVSLNGKIDEGNGVSSKSFYRYQNSSVRDFTHKIRSESDCIVIGRKTLETDNPYLSVDQELFPGKKISKVIVGRKPIKNENLNVFDGNGDVYFLGNIKHPIDSRVRLMPVDKNELEACEIVSSLRSAGFNRILIEGGAKLLEKFLISGSFDRLIIKSIPILCSSGASDFLDLIDSPTIKLSLLKSYTAGNVSVSEYELLKTGLM